MISQNDKLTFLDMIQKSCIDTTMEHNILPSVIASLGIIISNWGTTKEFYNTRNIYLLPADKEWSKQCYSKTSGHIYESIDQCTEIAPLLYRVYSDHRNSIQDFVYMMMNSRRTHTGPYRYSSIINVTDYKTVVEKLVRSGFMTDYLHRNNNVEYINMIIQIIEQYQLYLWDNSIKEKIEMAKKKHNNQKREIHQSTDPEHIYRVRLDWNKHDTQIFASSNYDDALQEALKHEGYKIYIDEDGELFEDPWIKVEQNDQEPIQQESPFPKHLLHALKGELVKLNHTPVYRMALDKRPMLYLTGDFYFYDNTVVNGRGKITRYQNITKPDPCLILGYIDLN